MLTFVVAGGGFSGTEVAAALNDFVREAVATTARSRPRTCASCSCTAAPACSSASSRRGWRHTPRRRSPSRASSCCSASAWSRPARAARCSPTARRISTRTLISTVPSSPNPIVEQLGLPSAQRAPRVRRDAGGQGLRGRVGGRGLRADSDARRRAVPAHRAARHSPGEGARGEHPRRPRGRAAALVRVQRPRQARRARPPPGRRRAARRRAPWRACRRG